MSQAALVSALVQRGVAKTDAVIIAMKAVDRRYFCERNPYSDSPQGIGHGVTISAPHMHAIQLEDIYPFLRDRDGVRFLDVGVGSGYLLACVGKILEHRQCACVGIDIIPELVDLADRNIRRATPELLDSGVVQVRPGNAWLPLAEEFDVIHVGAAAEFIPPSLVDALAPGGVMSIPVGDSSQHLFFVEKSLDGTVKQTRRLAVRFVPLVRR